MWKTLKGVNNNNVVICLKKLYYSVASAAVKLVEMREKISIR